jgi:hypothetical protein
MFATTWPFVVKPSSDVAELLFVSADQPRPMAALKLEAAVFVSHVAPNPKFVLAPSAVVAPLPPLLMAIVPVTLEAKATVGKFVSPAALPLVANKLAGKLVNPAALPLVAKTPTTFVAAIFVSEAPLFDAKLLNTVDDGWNADAAFVAADPRPTAVRNDALSVLVRAASVRPATDLTPAELRAKTALFGAVELVDPRI